MAQIVLDTQNGLTIPALTTAQKNAIASPNTGALVYDTTLGAVSDYNGSSWDVATVLSQFGNSLAANGYQKLPSGLIVQWGTAGNGTDYNVSYPIAFPNNVFAISANMLSGPITSSEIQAVSFGNVPGTLTFFSCYPRYQQTTGAGGISSQPFTWIAIGY